MLEALQFKMQKFPEIDRKCKICIDEMSLQSHLFYNVTKDQIPGFNTVNDNNEEPSKNVMVIMAQGLASKWKQPLGYYFVSHTFSGSELKTVVTNCILKLKQYGLIVNAVVSDQGSNFIQLSNSFGVSPLKPYFFIENLKVFYIFDVPHLFKMLSCIFKCKIIRYILVSQFKTILRF